MGETRETWKDWKSQHCCGRGKEGAVTIQPAATVFWLLLHPLKLFESESKLIKRCLCRWLLSSQFCIQQSITTTTQLDCTVVKTRKWCWWQWHCLPLLWQIRRKWAYRQSSLTRRRSRCAGKWWCCLSSEWSTSSPQIFLSLSSHTEGFVGLCIPLELLNGVGRFLQHAKDGSKSVQSMKRFYSEEGVIHVICNFCNALLLWTQFLLRIANFWNCLFDVIMNVVQSNWWLIGEKVYEFGAMSVCFKQEKVCNFQSCVEYLGAPSRPSRDPTKLSCLSLFPRGIRIQLF